MNKALTIASVIDAKERCAEAINGALQAFEAETGCVVYDLMIVKSSQNGVRVGLRVEVF